METKAGERVNRILTPRRELRASLGPTSTRPGWRTGPEAGTLSGDDGAGGTSASSAGGQDSWFPGSGPPRQTVSARVCSVQHGGQINGCHGDASALDAPGDWVHSVRAVNLAATSPLSWWYSPRLRAQLCLLFLLLLLLLLILLPFSQYSQTLYGGVLVSAVGPAGVDLRPKETRANSATLLQDVQKHKLSSSSGGHSENCKGLLL